MTRHLVTAVVATAALLLAVGTVRHQPQSDPQAFAPRFGQHGLVTNEFAWRSPNAVGATKSPDWNVTSGSLFADAGAGWTGHIDRRAPGPTSEGGTDSAVFRLVSRQRGFDDVRVAFTVRADEPSQTAATPPQAYDGVHLWLRYHSPQDLYAVSIARRDGLVVIKRKAQAPGEPDGTYTTLAETPYAFSWQAWVPVVVTVRNIGSSVAIQVSIAGRPVLRAVDHRPGILSLAGGLGLRGDNTEFWFRGLTASPL